MGGNVEDYFSTCSWDDGFSQGNFWHDFNGTGYYPIEDVGEEVTGYDHYPRILPNPDFGPPIISSPSDRVMLQGTAGSTIIWDASDENPSNFEIYSNGTSVSRGEWDGSSIIIPIHDLEKGVYELEVHVTDILGDSTSDIVILEVISLIPTTQSTSTTTSSTISTTYTTVSTYTTTPTSSSQHPNLYIPIELFLMGVLFVSVIVVVFIYGRYIRYEVSRGGS